MGVPEANALGLISAQHRSSTAFASVAVASAVYNMTAPKRVLWAQVEYISGTGAGNRRPIFEVYNSAGNLVLQSKALDTQSSSETNLYLFSPGGPREAAIAGSALVVGLPEEVIIPAGGQMKFETENGDGSDKMNVSYQITGV